MKQRISIFVNSVHPGNVDVATQVGAIAEGLSLDVVHNTSGTGGFSGWHRYVVLRRGRDRKSTSCRSRHTVAYTQTPYSRYYRPSIGGERRARCELVAELTELSTTH